MEQFRRYLEGRELSPNTVATYAAGAVRLVRWLDAEGIAPSEATYRDLLAWLRSLDVSPGRRNGLLTATRHYLSFLIEQGERSNNPARGLVVGGERRRLPHDLLAAEQLNELYRSYVGGSPARERNRAMLGLLVYQALHVHELSLLTPPDVDAEAGHVTVPNSRIAAGRVLWLDGRQVLNLHRYMAEARPALLAATGKQTGKLFTSAGSSDRLANALAHLMRELRERHGFFRDARQLRASRIALWLRTGHLREVQERAGHRYVSSTERYEAEGLDRLRAALAKHHPLR